MYDGDSTYNKYVVGMTGVLHMLQDAATEDIYFAGKRMNRIDISDLPYAKDWEFSLDDTTYDSLNDITEPQYQMVYKVGDNYYIFYLDSEFHEFELDDDGNEGLAVVEVQGDINYYGDVLRFTYA